MSHGRIDDAVQSEIGDTAIVRLLLAGVDAMLEQGAERVDRDLPEVGSRTPRPYHEGQLQGDAAVGAAAIWLLICCLKGVVTTDAVVRT